MDTMLWVGVAGLVVGVLLAAGALVLLRSVRRSQDAALAEARAETAALSAQVAALQERLTAPGARDAEFVITRAGDAAADDAADVSEPAVEGRLVLSAALTDPLLKTAALAHGVRRALSPETRNRIGFEMRREVRRARKERRREQKEALRRVQAERRMQVDDQDDAVGDAA